MNDMSKTIIPKSDQLNADDLLTGPRTITITGVTVKGGQEQPVSISYEGDNGKPYKACKSMCRVLVSAWGADSSKYVGRSMTLYCDPKVKWGGMEVGGIRISHMSDIGESMTMALTVTRANKKPFTVKPLPATKPSNQPTTAAPDGASTTEGRLPQTDAAGIQSSQDAATLSKEQVTNLLSYCEQTGVNISRVLLKMQTVTGLKIDGAAKIPAAMYQRCIDFIDAAAKQ